MAGYLYACQPEGDLRRVKIGSTLSDDPESHCRFRHGRALTPLHILRLLPTGNARVAVVLCHHLLFQDSTRGLFDLSGVRDGFTGEVRLDRALALVRFADEQAGACLPAQVDSHNTQQHTDAMHSLDGFLQSDRVRLGQGLYVQLAAFKAAARTWAQRQGVPPPDLHATTLKPWLESRGITISPKERRTTADMVKSNTLWLNGVVLA